MDEWFSAGNIKKNQFVCNKYKKFRESEVGRLAEVEHLLKDKITQVSYDELNENINLVWNWTYGGAAHELVLLGI